MIGRKIMGVFINCIAWCYHVIREINDHPIFPICIFFNF